MRQDCRRYTLCVNMRVFVTFVLLCCCLSVSLPFLPTTQFYYTRKITHTSFFFFLYFPPSISSLKPQSVNSARNSFNHYHSVHVSTTCYIMLPEWLAETYRQMRLQLPISSECASSLYSPL